MQTCINDLHLLSSGSLRFFNLDDNTHMGDGADDDLIALFATEAVNNEAVVALLTDKVTGDLDSLLVGLFNTIESFGEEIQDN